MNKCKYEMCYCYNPCGKDCDESGICEIHKSKKCVVCGEQATNECNYSGQFVCGAPLCNNCESGSDGNFSKGLGWGFIGHTHIKRKNKGV